MKNELDMHFIHVIVFTSALLRSQVTIIYTCILADDQYLFYFPARSPMITKTVNAKMLPALKTPIRLIYVAGCLKP